MPCHIGEHENGRKEESDGCHADIIPRNPSAGDKAALDSYRDGLRAVTGAKRRENARDVRLDRVRGYAELLADCTPEEIQALIRITKQLKETMRTHKAEE